MRKKFLILLVLVTAFLSSCDSHDQSRCLENVKQAYPNSRVVLLPNDKFRFIVIKKDSIVYVKTMSNFNADVTSSFEVQL